MCKHHSPAFKAQVTRELPKEEKSISRHDRIALLERPPGDLPLTTQAGLLGSNSHFADNS